MKKYLCFILFSTLLSQAQIKFKDYISSNFNKVAFDSVNAIIKDYEDLNTKQVSIFLDNNPSFKKILIKDGVKKEIVSILDGQPIYNTTYNFNSAKTIFADKLYINGGLGLDLSGEGFYAGVWDGGCARYTHTQFSNRVQIIDDAVVDNHATHVTGTIIASGEGNLAIRGIAYKGSVYGYDWTNDLSEMSSAFQNLNLLVSNHSYGTDASNAPLWLFGAYDNKAKLMDSLLFSSQFLLPIVAAGNDRDNFQQYNPQKNGYDLIGGFNSAKNVITVGAINQVLNYTSPDDVVMSSFSNWGPTDDGRIKPDVVAKGVNVRSTTSASDTSNGVLSGTSMASPAVAGVCLLLQQHYTNLFTNPMLASTLKGLILHTTEEAGPSEGPDYMFGWGLVNAQKAATVISNRGVSSIIEELTLSNNTPFSKTIQVQPGTPLEVSISWTDRSPSSANTGTVDLQTLTLVNDLDLRLSDGNQTYFPWTLDPSDPSLPASNQQDNFRDNFEKIKINSPSGIYNLTIKHKGNLVGGSQKFSLIITGNQLSQLNNNDFSLSKVNIFPNPVNNELNVNLNDINLNSSLSICDIQGRIIKIYYDLKETNKIDVTELQSGIYILKVTSNGGDLIKKFIKK